jgi:hypothetical protein
MRLPPAVVMKALANMMPAPQPVSVAEPLPPRHFAHHPPPSSPNPALLGDHVLANAG